MGSAAVGVWDDVCLYVEYVVEECRRDYILRGSEDHNLALREHDEVVAVLDRPVANSERENVHWRWPTA